MERIRRKSAEGQRGFTLLLAVLIASIVLAIGLAILNITLKEFLLANIARDSEIAFYAADAGMECALYFDGASRDVFLSGGTVDCVGSTESISAASAPTPGSPVVQNFDFTWGSPAVCADVTVTKLDCNDVDSGIVPGSVCTRVESRGYNRSCSNINSNRTVERALRALY